MFQCFGTFPLTYVDGRRGIDVIDRVACVKDCDLKFPIYLPCACCYSVPFSNCMAFRKDVL